MIEFTTLPDRRSGMPEVVELLVVIQKQALLHLVFILPSDNLQLSANIQIFGSIKKKKNCEFGLQIKTIYSYKCMTTFGILVRFSQGN
ncbi:MAG: hypothetical protein ACLFUB_07615 [Cyclobacteriaceae bacterium]